MRDRFFVADQIEQRLGEILRRGIVLHQFRHDKAFAQDVGQTIIGEIARGFQPPRQGIHAIGDHHGTLEQRGFQRGGSRCDQHAIGSGHRILGMPEQHGDRQLVGIAIINGLLKDTAGFAAHQRHQEACIRKFFKDQPGGLDIDTCKTFDFALAAAGQKCENFYLRGNAHRLAHLGAFRLIWQHIGERMAYIIHRHADLLIDFWLMREQRDHVRNCALDLVDTLSAPRPYRRAGVMDGGNAMLFERELQAEIEVGRVHTDKHIRTVGQKIFAQLAAYAKDLAEMFEDFDVAVHREFFHGEQHFHSSRLHLGSPDADELQIGANRLQGGDQMAAEHIPRCFARDDTDHSLLCHGYRPVLADDAARGA